VKEERRSPGPSTKKRKLYSTDGSNPIGTIDDFDDTIIQVGGKRGKAVSGSTSQARSEVATGQKPPRRSTRGAKANSKKDIGELFRRLGQEFAKTCDEIADSIQ
jgi:hypothetical protein